MVVPSWQVRLEANDGSWHDRVPAWTALLGVVGVVGRGHQGGLYPAEEFQIRIA